MKFKAIIFDMDGTIVDTSHIWVEATRCLIAAKGIVLTPELEARIAHEAHGLAMDKVCHILKDMMTLEDSVDKLIEEKTALACDLYRQGLIFIDGFEDFYKQVLAYNLKSAIATNADNCTLYIVKELLNLERFFGSHIYNISCVNNICKPDPAVYLHAAQQLAVDPRECIALEDSAHGIKAAQRAGMFCIGINTSRNYNQVKHADLIVDAYSEINLKKLLEL
jgi:HAD superfamily hydrolase (TIGR01509 family)